MPRKIASQVGSSVSRLLSVGSLKAPPAFFSALTLHPPNSNPQRSPSSRINHSNDVPTSTPTPPNLNPAFIKRKNALYHNFAAATESKSDDLLKGIGNQKRNPLNQAKRRRAQSPKLNPLPIVYLSDRVRRQFFRDHPWELNHPRNLVEMDTVLKPIRNPGGGAMELRDWGINPGVEEVIACTLHLHQNHSLSLSQAYHRTLSEYHTLRAEHETRSRFAVYEARSFGAYFDRTESERGFRIEEKNLNGWRTLKEERMRLEGLRLGTDELNSQDLLNELAGRDEGRFTGGQEYLEKARESLQGFREIKNSDHLKASDGSGMNIQVNNPSSPEPLKGQHSPALGPGSFAQVDSEERAADLSADPSGKKVVEKELEEKVDAGLKG